ncbi:MAG TPA: DNA primase [Candidatus Babeliales bacterium]|nr:DNA primase [Candidatus Babeliales bacterium]
MNLFSFIKERVSILDVINEYVTLKKAGGYHKGTCPFHHEKTASFTVSPDKNIFYCFGCHLSGDVISFIAKIENCSQKDAAKLLAEKHNINLPQSLSFEFSEKHNDNKQNYFSICRALALWCHEQLLKNSSAQSYFLQRGFEQSAFDYFTLGYFPSGNTSISDLLYTMKRQSILARDLIEANILIEGRTTLYSPFEERLIFPIKNALGNFCGFGGRIFKEQDTRPKYYNSRENEYFIKGSLLFNLDKAKKSIQETGKIFLVEGYTDCMAMIQQGIANTVATLGTACTIEHLKQLARYAEHIFVVYDNDTAGKQAILRLTELCWHVNLELKVILLPPNEDPASFITKKGDFQELIHGAQDIFIFFIDTLGNNFSNKSLHQKIQTTRSFLQVITGITDSLKKDILLQKAAVAFDISFNALKEELIRLNSQQSTVQNNAAQSNVTIISNPLPLLEKRIFCAIINNMKLFNGESRLRLIHYLPSPLRDILAKLRATQEKSEIVTFSIFFDTLDEHEKHYVSKLLLEENEIMDNNAFDKLLEQLQKKQWKVIVRDIKIQLMQAKQEGNVDKVSLILHDLINLQNKLISSPHQDNL